MRLFITGVRMPLIYNFVELKKMNKHAPAELLLLVVPIWM